MGPYRRRTLWHDSAGLSSRWFPAPWSTPWPSCGGMDPPPVRSQTSSGGCFPGGRPSGHCRIDRWRPKPGMTPQGAVLVFWSSVALIAYGYLGYPVLVYLLGRLRGRPHLREEITPRISLLALASNFADARVGCVSGIYRVVPGDRQGSGGAEAVYWRYETFIRHAEARLGSMLGAHGALYAIRRELFEPLDAGTRNEDFILPVIILMKGYRSVYDIRAVATEDAGEMTGFSRRVSLAAGNYQQMALLWKRGGWLRKPFLVFQLWSHKGLRLVTPLLLLGMYLSNLWLDSSSGGRAVFAPQTVFFTPALLW